MPYKSFWLATAISAAAIIPSYAAAQMLSSSSVAVSAHFVATDYGDYVIRVKNDKDDKKVKKNAGKAHGNKKDKVERRTSKDTKKVDKGAGKYLNRAMRSNEDRLIASQRLMAITAPQNRDMTTLLSALPLALLGGNVIFQDIRDDRLLTYRNCPPGLAKKDPPCVPPGLAKKGVTYDQWVSYDDRELERIHQDRRDSYLRAEGIQVHDIDQIDESGFLLNSDQVARLYNLSPAPNGQRYALIDGMPVLLETKNYSALGRINDMAGVPVLDNNVQIAPTAALTQAELMQAYRLPQLDTDHSYSVVNGEVLVLENDAFEILQLIRIARAVF